MGKAERGSAIDEMGCSRHAKALKIGRAKMQRIDPLIEEQFANGRLLAAISSRPGQTGRCDGYVLEGEELSSTRRSSSARRRRKRLVARVAGEAIAWENGRVLW